jgi:heat-inducible transcriptional repressor
MTKLTSRRQAVLGMVIRSYIDKGQPVGSKAFVEDYGLEISPATIRNEMAVLEELGFLTHPHTSAGRMPTEQGYRYFVQHLLGDTELPLTEQYMIRHQFHQAGLELDRWLSLAVAVLAHTTRKAALATSPRVAENRFKHLELINLRDSMVLMVLVLEGGTVKQQVLNLEQSLEQESLSRISNQLNELFAGLSADQIPALLESLPVLPQQIALIVDQVLALADRQANPIYRDGLVHILEEPAFLESGHARQMVQALEGSLLVDVVNTAAQPLEVGDIQVLIGGEGRWQELAELSLVLSRYGVEGGASGLLGVVGPTRMTYDRIIGAVRYVSRLMSDLVRDRYACGPTASDFSD